MKPIRHALSFSSVIFSFCLLAMGSSIYAKVTPTPKGSVHRERVYPTVGQHKNNNNTVVKKLAKPEFPTEEIKVTPPIAFGDFSWKYWGKIREELYYGDNTTLLNHCNIDEIFYFRHVFDGGFSVKCGTTICNKPAVESRFDVRNKSVWGNSGSIAFTSYTQTKTLDAFDPAHRHSIPRHIFWMREGWVRFDLGHIFSQPAFLNHTFMAGAFPFKLGRGIALGDAYTISPGFLGFYSESAIDQYAFGMKLGGPLRCTLNYDLYGAILENKSDSFSAVNAQVLAQQYGHLECPARGFGKINYIFAGRLFWNAIDDGRHELNLEPYFMYNHEPEQQLEFKADASSRLGTFGMAGEFDTERFGFGFDTAFNVGTQRVKGWDRNVIEQANRMGVLTFVNSHVVDQNGDKIVYNTSTTDGREVIDIINLRAYEDESQNGKQIGEVAGVDIINADNRFRNPYSNAYKGWMIIADASVYFYNKELAFSVMGGAASGDEDPNRDNMDRDFTGFIGLQEIYSGNSKRVRSAFVLGGAGRIVRPLSEPVTNQAPTRFSQLVTGFTNLNFFGTSVRWEPTAYSRKFLIHPNILAYWQNHATKAYDIQLMQDSTKFARNYLGLEINLFADVYLTDCLKLYSVSSIFFPGSHYADIKGKPLNSAQKKSLERLDPTGFTADEIPNVGDDIAFTVNLGLEYKF